MAKSIKGLQFMLHHQLIRIFSYANDCVKLILPIVFYAESDKGTITEKPARCNILRDFSDFRL
jgi:hypothetical protein